MKCSFLKIAFFICGLLIPFPLFFEIGTKSFILIKFSPNVYTFETQGAVSLGYFALVIISALIQLMSGFKFNQKIMCRWGFYVIFFGFLLLYVSLSRALSLISLFIFIQIIANSDLQKLYLDRLIGGYVIGVSIVLLSKIFEFGFCGLVICDAPHSRALWGYEIYQYFVSFAAVTSLMAVVCLILILISSNRNIWYLVIIFLLLVNEVAITYRKGPIVEMFFAFFLLSSTLFYSSGKKISAMFKKKLSYSMFLAFIAGSVFIFSVQSNRELFSYAAFADRIGTYLIASQDIETPSAKDSNAPVGINKSNAHNSSAGLDKVNPPLIISESGEVESFLFGYFRGWGGYGNSFLEFFMRMGLFGLVFFMAALAIMFQNIYRILECTIGIGGNTTHMVRLLLFAVFVFSIIFGNFINLNIQVPYYYTNLVLLILCSKFYLDEIGN